MAIQHAPQQPLRRRLNEVGKIRIGCQVPIERGKNAGKPRPERLKCFRLTSNSRAALEMAATKYGGAVQPWTIRPEWQESVRAPDHALELYTESVTLDVIVRADALMDTQFEQWDGAYCTRRCSGEFITFDGYGKLQGLECQCPNDLDVRKAQAAQGKACMAVSRLCVMLEGLPLGQWRLDTRGENTPAEIRGLQDILDAAGVGASMLRATMRLEFRTSRQMVSGEKQVHHYSCVVIEPRFTPEQLLAEGAKAQTRLLAMPDEHAKSVEEHINEMWDTSHGSTVVTPQPHAAHVEAVIEPLDDGQLLPQHGLAAYYQRLGWSASAIRAWQNAQTRRMKKNYGDFSLEELQDVLSELLKKYPELVTPEEPLDSVINAENALLATDDSPAPQAYHSPPAGETVARPMPQAPVHGTQPSVIW